MAHQKSCHSSVPLQQSLANLSCCQCKCNGELNFLCGYDVNAYMYYSIVGPGNIVNTRAGRKRGSRKCHTNVHTNEVVASLSNRRGNSADECNRFRIHTCFSRRPPFCCTTACSMTRQHAPSWAFCAQRPAPSSAGSDISKANPICFRH